MEGRARRSIRRKSRRHEPGDLEDQGRQPGRHHHGELVHAHHPHAGQGTEGTESQADGDFRHLGVPVRPGFPRQCRRCGPGHLRRFRLGPGREPSAFQGGREEVREEVRRPAEQRGFKRLRGDLRCEGRARTDGIPRFGENQGRLRRHQYHPGDPADVLEGGSLRPDRDVPRHGQHDPCPVPESEREGGAGDGVPQGRRPARIPGDLPLYYKDKAYAK